jgi:hypothetical protein
MRLRYCVEIMRNSLSGFVSLLPGRRDRIRNRVLRSMRLKEDMIAV